MQKRRPESRVGGNIRAALQNAGMTQAALAKELGVSPGAVSNWLKGRRIPDDADLQRIAAATKMPVEELHGLTPEEQGDQLGGFLIQLAAAIQPGQTLLDVLLQFPETRKLSPSEQQVFAAATDHFLEAILAGRLPGADRLSPAQRKAAEARLRRYGLQRRSNGQ